MTDVEAMFTRYFETKSSADVEGTMAFFSRNLVCYVDATLGWDLPGYEALRAVFEQYMPNWSPPARSYATKVLADDHGALLHMTDTPELFGGELRILAAVDMVDGEIVRWVDYWDGATFDHELYAQLRTPSDQFPTDLEGRTRAGRLRADRLISPVELRRRVAARARWPALVGRRLRPTGREDRHRRSRRELEPAGEGLAAVHERPLVALPSVARSGLS